MSNREKELILRAGLLGVTIIAFALGMAYLIQNYLL
jgi:hypothetical protein